MRGVLGYSWLVAAWGALALALAVNAAPMILMLDAIRQLAPQTAIAALIVASSALFLGAPRGALLFGLAAVVFALPAVSAAAPAPITPGAPIVSILVHNTHSGRATVNAIEGEALAADADIVALVESWPEQTRRLKRLREHYPYAIQLPGDSQLAVFSRLPIRLLEPQPEVWPVALYLEFDGPGGPIRLSVVHLARPWPFSHPVFQRTEITRLTANLVEGRPRVERPTILVGDFNAAPWGHVAARLQNAGLSPAGGLAGTWPSFAPDFLRVPIDNAFVAGGVRSVGKRVLGNTGSDHLPVVFEFQTSAQSTK